MRGDGRRGARRGRGRREVTEKIRNIQRGRGDERKGRGEFAGGEGQRGERGRVGRV